MKRTTITLICIALFFMPELTGIYVQHVREQQREQLMRYNDTYKYLNRGLKP